MLKIPPSLCLACRGGKYLCGLAYCPIMVRITLPSIEINNIIEGSTPPSIFVGRIGYPRVNVGPLLTPFNDDARIYDTPELWSNLKLDEILKFRLSLVRGSITYDIHSANDPDRRLLQLQELAIARDAVSAEMKLANIKSKPYLSEDIPPFGPSGRMISFTNSNISVDKRIEKVWYDHDLRAKDAIIKLYDEHINISSIVKAFSIGMLGKRRRLVPTRWSITAIDDTLSKVLVDRLKEYHSINEYLVYVRRVSMNTFVCILMPTPWQFEWIEAWFPSTTWNMLDDGEAVLMSDHEGYKGIDHYARVGGCYYSARLATAEHLNACKRQGGALLLREIYPGFNLPIGVWFVREQLRAMFKATPMIFNNVRDALNYAMSNLRIPLSKWREHSIILQGLKQRRIIDYT